MEILRVLAFLLGLALVIRTVFSAIRTFVVPRSVNDWITRTVFRNIRRIFNLILNRLDTYNARDRVLALYAPISLLCLPLVWLSLVIIGYMGMYWAIGADEWTSAFSDSGSSLLTLGFAPVSGFPMTVMAFTEAILGLILTALLIAYLPTMYGAFQHRERAVTMLEVRAGVPPSPTEMLLRAHRIKGLDALYSLWIDWEGWFADIEESHTSLGALTFFRSPKPHRSWVVAAGTVLDAAALMASSIDKPRRPEPELCIRAGYLALRSIADFFRIGYNPNPKYGDPIRLTKEQFYAAYEELAAAGLPLKPDREQAWHDFAGWRVNYEAVLFALAGLTMSPPAPWLPEQPWTVPRFVKKFKDKG